MSKKEIPKMKIFAYALYYISKTMMGTSLTEKLLFIKKDTFK